jgi:chromosome segregation ATPase
MNSSLHTRLNQATAGETVSAAGSFANLDASANVEGKTPLAWIEERRSLEQRAAQLTEECRALETEKASFAASSNVAAAPEPPGVIGLLRNRDDMRQRLHASEVARCAAEHRVATAEAALTRTQEELTMRKQRQQGALEEARFGPWLAEEVKSLRRELTQEQTKIDEANLALARKSDQLTRAEKEQAEARIEYDALVAANETLRKEIAAMKDKVEADRQCSRSAEAELGELQAQYRLREYDLNSEIQDAKARAQTAEDSLKDRRSALQASEASAAEAKAEGLELQGQLEVLRAAHTELLAQEEREAVEHANEAASLRARSKAVSADKSELEKHLQEVETATCELQASDLECKKQYESTSRELEALRTRGADMARRSQDAMSQAEQRIQALLQQLSDERQQNLELEREISVAREAAGEVSSAPWEIARDKAAGKPKGWASTSLQMHRELELLQRWKHEALETFRRMQVDMDTAQQQYQQQLQHNQGLQERLEQMGQQAKTAIGAFPSTALSRSAEEPPLPPCLPAFVQQPGNSSLAGSSSALQATSSSALSRTVAGTKPKPHERDVLPLGPDVPERPDLPSQVRASDLRPVPNAAYNFAAFAPLNQPVATHSVTSGGPVGGPFYDAYCARPSQGASRLAARAEASGGSRRRRAASAGRVSTSAVVAPLLSGVGANRPVSAGGGRRR